MNTTTTRALLVSVLIVAAIWSTVTLTDTPTTANDEAIPPAPTHYMGREIARTMHYSGAEWLIRETRESEEAVADLVAQLGVEPGMTVCDMGCGNGFYTLRMSQDVGENGTVFAVDIQPEMLQMLKRWAAKADADNIIPVLGSVVDPKLPANEIDLMLLVDVYHEFSHPKHMLERIHASMKDDGRVAVVEYRAEDPTVPIRPLHKMSKQQILKEWTANGFELVDQYDGLPWQHLMFFRAVNSTQ